MGYLNFTKANCRNCYKCLRSCPVKAIKFKNGQAEIIEERCIACGQCLVVCPQDARNVESDLLKIKNAIRQNKKVIASIAPSFIGAFPGEEGQIISSIKNLGFYSVEETAAGAEIVAQYYRKYLKSGEYDNLITTSCPSANYLIEVYFPSLIKYMIPVVSPMIAHGKMLKEAYGSDSFVVFIGPCIAKKYEAVDCQHEGIIDAVLTFEELQKWICESPRECDCSWDQSCEGRMLMTGRRFPVEGGVIAGLLEEPASMYKEYYAINGIERCMEILKSMDNGEIKGACLEINACKGGCIGGPGMPENGCSYFRRQQKVKNFAKSGGNHVHAYSGIDLEDKGLKKTFFDKSLKREKADEEEINKVLRKMGKYEPFDELNCGVCGYNTCREKAQAVYEGMAEVDMCLHFMRNKAESLTNVIFEYTPNVIIILDEELNIKEFNPTAERVFNISADKVKCKPISVLMDDTRFLKVKESKQGILRHKVNYPEYDVVLIEDILYLEKENIILAIMTNITMEEKHERELAMVKENTLNAAQEVINKQMMVAQEIASLLGETTAETKLTLTKLKRIAMGEIGDSK